jgi:acyl-coenzyme A synthetase/AMP-(fatty) acid ligase
VAWKSLAGYDKVLWAAAYGTTETTVTSTFYTSAYHDDLSHEPHIPIGKPIANTYTYILDDDLHEVLVGTEGELYIGGDGVARGYLNQPESTKKNFIANPFRHEPGSIIYKTGDKARYRPDGNIVCLGRMDFQIKLNGLRIEPGEIESVLSKLPWVKACVVVLHGAELHESLKHLVAFISTIEDHTFRKTELQSVSSDYLPKLMVPKHFIHIPTFPLNGNGKVDRKHLESTCECSLA